MAYRGGHGGGHGGGHAPPQQEHTVPGLGRVGGNNPPSRGSAHGSAHSGGMGGNPQVQQVRRNEPRQQPHHGQQGGQAPQRGQAPPQHGYAAPAPQPGYQGRIPSQQQHEVPGLNLGGGASPFSCLLSRKAFALNGL